MEKWANLPNSLVPKTFDNFESRPGTEIALAAAKIFPFAGHMAENEDDPINDFTTTQHHILMFTGRNGCGKSHLLEAIARRMLEAEMLVRYEYVLALLDDLRAAYEDNAEVRFAEKWGAIMRADVLFLDDLGAERGTEWSREKLTALIDQRYRNDESYLVVATNLDFNQMAEQLGYRIADRLFDEHTGNVLSINITATSYRTGKAWGQPSTPR